MTLYDLGEFYINELLTCKLDIKVHGISIFKEDKTNEGIEKDYFITGKIMNLVSRLAVRDEKHLKTFDLLREILDDLPMKTWGILYYLEGLYRLKKHGLLEKITPIDDLNEILHYKHFLNTDSMQLDNLPTNYYNVAFSVCKYRELLNFENNGFSEKILKCFVNHVKKYSKTGFMDETSGDGRYDRYSLLTSSEIAMTLTDVGLEVPNFIKEMIIRSKDVVLLMANEDGDGITYGRSVGAYGDTAVHQILSTAYKLKLLTDEELDISYEYMKKSLKKYYNFWLVDSKHININAYDRKTDNYRHLRRSLGESISILIQWMDILKKYQNITPNKVKFKKVKKYIELSDNPLRGLYIHNDKRLAILGISSGTKQYYKMASYQPIPQITKLIESPAINEPIYYPYLYIDGHYYIAHHNIESIKLDENEVKIKLNKLHRLDDFNITIDYDFLIKIKIIDLEVEITFVTEGFDDIILYLPFFEEGSTNEKEIYLLKSKVELKNIDKVTTHESFCTNHGRYQSVFSLKTNKSSFGYKIKFNV